MSRVLTLFPLIGLVLLAALVAVALQPQDPYVYPGDGQALAEELPLPKVRDLSTHLSGRVLDASGAGVADASLVVLQDGRVHWTYSSQGGDFDLPGLAPGGLEVALDHSRYPATLMEGVAGPTPIDLVLPAAHGAGPSVPQPQGVDLSARIQSADPTDLTGFEVALAPSAPPNAPGTGRPRRARTDSEGYFRIAGLTPGEYLVRVIPPGHPGATWPDLLSDLDGPTLRFTHPQESITFSTVAGIVAGTYHAPAGHYPGGALVQIRPHGASGPDARPMGRVLVGRTAADGSFHIPHVPPGAYRAELVSGDQRLESILVMPRRGRIDPGF
ncbi:hypothetical protein CMO84_02670 [Candidatus Woesearchaeota archaeon]|nr:hypothetical protein [Candidatus Woesearchaeota archaeon]